MVKHAEFSKVLARNYIEWFQDCHESAIYCREVLKNEQLAQKYLDDAEKYLTIIMENWEAIEFFSVGDRAFLYDGALPEKFRGYK